MDLSFEVELPQDPMLKNKIWKEKVLPRRKLLLEIFANEKTCDEARCS